MPSLRLGSLTVSNGKLYGVTVNGGANGEGVFFEWNPATDIFTKKIDFNSENKFIQFIELMK